MLVERCMQAKGADLPAWSAAPLRTSDHDTTPIIIIATSTVTRHSSSSTQALAKRMKRAGSAVQW